MLLFNFFYIDLKCLYSTFIVSLVTEVLLGGCRIMNIDPDKALVDGVDDVQM